jgi:LPS export ABC transporter protein LptC
MRSGPPAVRGPGSAPSSPPPSPAAARPSAISRATATPALPSIRIEESRIRGADPAGRVQWELRATGLQVDADREEVRLTGVEGTFLEKGKPAVTFIAPRALFAMQTRDIILTGGVRARAGDDRSVEAREIRYLAARRVLIASGGVRLMQERMIVRADRLESDVALRRTRLTGHITVTIRE